MQVGQQKMIIFIPGLCHDKCLDAIESNVQLILSIVTESPANKNHFDCRFTSIHAHTDLIYLTDWLFPGRWNKTI